jgi:very-short-patch-repair endonuclease
LGEGAIDVRLAAGRLHRLHRGVYAVGHQVLADEGRWMAAVLAGGAGAALSHKAAAALWSIRPTQSPGIEVTIPRKVGSRPGLRFHHSYLPADEVTVHAGIPVTTVPRTLFDLAAVVPAGQLRRAVNEAELRRLWDPLSLADLLARHPRRPGAAAIRAALRVGARITRSELEDRFLDFLRRTRLPAPATNVPLWLGSRWIEADCVWRQQRLVVELDGYATHRTRAAYESDRARDRALTAAGWRVVRVTWRQLHEEPAALARDLRAALGRPEGLVRG